MANTLNKNVYKQDTVNDIYLLNYTYLESTYTAD